MRILRWLTKSNQSIVIIAIKRYIYIGNLYLSEVFGAFDLGLVAEHVHLVEVVDLQLVVRQVETCRGQLNLLLNIIFENNIALKIDIAEFNRRIIDENNS